MAGVRLVRVTETVSVSNVERKVAHYVNPKQVVDIRVPEEGAILIYTTALEQGSSAGHSIAVDRPANLAAFLERFGHDVDED